MRWIRWIGGEKAPLDIMGTDLLNISLDTAAPYAIVVTSEAGIGDAISNQQIRPTR